MGKRLANVKGRIDSDFKPWLDNATASKVARKLIKKKGCFTCGTRDSWAIVENEISGKRTKVNYFYPITNGETGETKLLCVPCKIMLDTEIKKEYAS